MEQNLEKTLDEIFEKIPAACYFDLFYSLNPTAYEGLKLFMQKFLSEEIDSIPRHSIFNAKEKEFTVDEQQRVQKSFYKLIKDYLNDDFNSNLNKNTKIDGIYLVYCYDSPVELNTAGKPIKRQILMNWNNYEKNLALLVTKVQILYF